GAVVAAGTDAAPGHVDFGGADHVVVPGTVAAAERSGRGRVPIRPGNRQSRWLGQQVTDRRRVVGTRGRAVEPEEAVGHDADLGRAAARERERAWQGLDGPD